MTHPQSTEAGTLDRFVVVPASYVFFLRDDHVLLQLRQNTGYMDDHWAAAAAGHVEKGETAYDAARREALEEVGVTDLELDVRHRDAAHAGRRADRRAHRLLLHLPVLGRYAADHGVREGRRPRLVPARRGSPTRSCRTS